MNCQLTVSVGRIYDGHRVLMRCEDGWLVLRADADEMRGAGHVMRSLAIGVAWRSRGGSVDFLSSDPAPFFRKKIESWGLNLIEIERPYLQDTDLLRTITHLSRIKHRSRRLPWVVIDGYHFDGDYQTKLRAAGSRLLVIDDNADLNFYDADCLVNHGLQAASLEYRCAPECRKLLGPRYALLRPEFASAINIKKGTPRQAERVLVTMGGSDPTNVTEKVVRALHLIDSTIEARVIVGFMNPYRRQIQAAARRLTHRVRIESAVANMTEPMLWADMAVTAAGGTCWELAALGVPMISLVIAENQRAIGAELERAGAGLCLGWHSDVGAEAIAWKVRELARAPQKREQMKRQGRELVDGRGAQRVIDAMLSARDA